MPVWPPPPARRGHRTRPSSRRDRCLCSYSSLRQHGTSVGICVGFFARRAKNPTQGMIASSSCHLVILSLSAAPPGLLDQLAQLEDRDHRQEADEQE